MIHASGQKPQSVELDRQALDGLRKRVSGSVLTGGEPGYDESRTIWNGMIDKRPAVIVRAIDEVDVQRAVVFARDQGLSLSVKSGGHNVAGYAVTDGGVMIDLSEMRAVRVDPILCRAYVEGGAIWRGVDAATTQHGLATTGGVISSTGVAGLTLGGGIGWLVGKHGMSIDNLVSATIVTASGDIITASQESNPDLFWAIRGGGGNFGVLTSFELALHPQGDVLAGFVAYPVSEAREVLEFYRQFTRTAPDELGAYAQISTDVESGMRLVAIAVFWPGDLAEGERILAPLRSFKTPLMEMIGPMPYVEWQQAFDADFPHGRRYYWKGALMRELNDRVLDAMVEHASETELPWSMAVIEWYRGQMNQVEPGATAFANREAQYQVIAVGGWDDPADDETGIAWARGFIETWSRTPLAARS